MVDVVIMQGMPIYSYYNCASFGNDQTGSSCHFTGTAVQSDKGCIIIVVISCGISLVPRPLPIFQCCMQKIQLEWPGDEATVMQR